ncbi:pectinesterase family protein [Domibacillus robiginosus]|uniref:pectinesterase family protein n=1 Tax=Domibacillus robiginosus TaxID=1071054 RepID=UPI0009E4BA1A|nr:pectinesterase family protein [Domibacillus robiginosus]
MIIVAKDGSGAFTTIQEAIDSIPETNMDRVAIYIQDGVYNEKLFINKPFVSLIGTSPDRVVITYGDHAKKRMPDGKPMGTFSSYSIFAGGDDFTAENITFENSAGCGKEVGQAVAVYVEGDRMIFRRCRFTGSQDTLFTGPLPPKPIEGNTFGGPMEGEKRKKGRSLFQNCYIEGDIDFIFGSATAVFQSCEIFSLDRQEETNGYITAASTPEGQPFGYVFLDCRLTSEAKPETVYLGRPWRDFARTVFINCWMGAHIKREGWHNWDKAQAETTVFYAEYGSRGPGGNRNNRVEWAKELSAQEASLYTPEHILHLKEWPSFVPQEKTAK